MIISEILSIGRIFIDLFYSIDVYDDSYAFRTQDLVWQELNVSNRSFGFV